MSALTDTFVVAVKAASVAQAAPVLAATKKSFIDAFSGFIQPDDMIDLDHMFSAALDAKIRQFSAPTLEAASIAAREYEASLDAMETIGLQYEIVGKAKVGKLVRSFAHTLISGTFAVLGAGVQAVLGVAFPVVGTVGGAILNSGLQHVVSYFIDS